jgi:importin-9
LKVQVVKTLDKLRTVYVQAISPHATALFEAVWAELARLATPYDALFVSGTAEGKLVDSDNLPCSLDALLLEELDFLQVMIKAPPVRKELTAQLQQLDKDVQHTAHWLQELIRVLVAYAKIPKEEEALWEYDANLYLSEATSLTANYTPRAACAELAVRSLGEWLKQLPIVAMLHFNQHNISAQTHWKDREALLSLCAQLRRWCWAASSSSPPYLRITKQPLQQHSQVPSQPLRAIRQMWSKWPVSRSCQITSNAYPQTPPDPCKRP